MSWICRYSKAAEAKIEYHATKKYVQISFEDDGIPYNPLEHNAPDITLNTEEREVVDLASTWYGQ